MAMSSKTLYLAFSLFIVGGVVKASEEQRQRGEDVGPCLGCKIYAEGFEIGLQRTTNLANSPGRLASIIKEMTEDPRYQKCIETVEKAWPHAEQWLQLTDAPNFFEFICIEKLEVCCPKQHYGRQCLPCQGWTAAAKGGETEEGNGGVVEEGKGGEKGEAGEMCSGHGRCRGDGTRKGNGTCLCDAGYGGEFCGECLTGYYLTDKDSKWQCKSCHYSCTGGCHNGSPRDCVACKPGFVFDEHDGCQDINECRDARRCGRDEFCVNTMGSHACVACDEACKGCHGNGNDMCRKCAEGYSRRGKHCVKEIVDQEMHQMTATRYMTYLGLLIAGAVLYPRTPSLAAGVGALTLSYIALAEFYCHSSGHASLLDLPLFTI